MTPPPMPSNPAPTIAPAVAAAGTSRRQLRIPEPGLRLESGQRLGPVTLAYETWGSPEPGGANAVLLLHSFSSDSHAAGPAGEHHPQPGWWDGLIGPGRAIDTDRYWVICPAVLGGCGGSTGPASTAADGRPWGSRFPLLTIRDMVAAETALADALGVRRWHAVIGGSMGGMRALEWAVSHPQRVARLVVLAAPARCTAENIAFHHCQIQAIEADPRFRGGDYYDDPEGGPRQGLALARSIARLTYGCEKELEQHLARAAEPLVEAFLQEDARQLVERFDANSYRLLTRAMSSHDLGRGRGGVTEALGRIIARTRVVAVSSDRLFPPHRQRELAAAIRSGVTWSTLETEKGHDGFLAEVRQLDPILRQSLG